MRSHLLCADGAYDSWHNYELITARGALPVIPPRSNAKIRQHGNCMAPPLLRDENLRQIRIGGRKAWMEWIGRLSRSLLTELSF